MPGKFLLTLSIYTPAEGVFGLRLVWRESREVTNIAPNAGIYVLIIAGFLRAGSCLSIVLV